MSAPGAAVAFPVPTYFTPAPAAFGRRPAPPPSAAAAAAPAPASPVAATHLQHAVRYSSKTLVLDHMLFLQLNARVRQLRRSSSSTLAAGGSSGSQPGGPPSGDEPTEVDRLGYGRRTTLPNIGGTGDRSRALARTISQPALHRLPSPIAEEEDESAELEAKAAGYERMLSVLLERVRLSSSGLSTPVAESNASGSDEEEEDDDDDDYIVSPPEEDAEDDVLPEGVRLRLGLAGLVDVLARPEGELERRSEGTQQQPDGLVAAAAAAARLSATPSTPTPSPAQKQALALLEPLLPPQGGSRIARRRPASSAVTARAKAWFDAGVADVSQTGSGPASDGLRASRSPTPAPAASSSSSRRGSNLSAFSTSGLGPAPDRWYDLARPATTTSSAAGAAWSPVYSPSLGGPAATSERCASADDGGGAVGAGRWVELLERFLLVSADLASAVGRSTIDEEERRRRARSSARGGVLRPLVARGGHGFTPAFGPGAGAQVGAAGGGWAARLGRAAQPTAFTAPAVVWESDSEESVDEAEDERRAAGEVESDDDDSDGDDDAMKADDDDDGQGINGDSTMCDPSKTTTAMRPAGPSRRVRRISNPPARSRSSSVGSTSSPPRGSKSSSTGAEAASVDRATAARPTRAWFALLAALVRQVVLSGFLDSAWRGLDSAESVLAIGCTAGPAFVAAGDNGGPSGRNGNGGSVSSSGSATGAEAVVGGLERAGLVLFGAGGAEESSGSKRRREYRRASKLTLQEARPSLNRPMHLRAPSDPPSFLRAADEPHGRDAFP